MATRHGEPHATNGTLENSAGGRAPLSKKSPLRRLRANVGNAASVSAQAALPLTRESDRSKETHTAASRRRNVARDPLNSRELRLLRSRTQAAADAATAAVPSGSRSRQGRFTSLR